MKFILILAMIVFNFSAQVNAAVVFSEPELLEMLEQSPHLKAFEAQIEKVEAQINGTLLNFSPNLEATLRYNRTNEPSLIIFDPPPKPYYSTEVKLNNNTMYGVGYSLGVLGESIESLPSDDPGAFSFNSARINPTFSVSMDLLKNRFGSETLNQVRSLRANLKTLNIEKEITKENLNAKLRTLFWTHNILVEKRKINERLLVLSKKLLKDIRKKKKDGLVESGDLYSAQSQTSGQNSNVALISYQIEKVKKNLSSLLPNLPLSYDLKTVQLGSEDSKVFYNCLQTILSYKEAPLELSYLSNQIDERKKSLNFVEDSLKSFSKPSLKIMAQLSGSNVDTRYLQALEDYADESRYGFSVGLSFSMPLSNYSKKQRKNLINSERFQVKSENEKDKAELRALHQETISGIKLLNQALKDQKDTTSTLEKSYKFKQKQYKQARVDLFDVIQEQNNYLGSELNQLNIVQVIVETLLEYKSKFQKFSCQGGSI